MNSKPDLSLVVRYTWIVMALSVFLIGLGTCLVDTSGFYANSNFVPLMILLCVTTQTPLQLTHSPKARRKTLPPQLKPVAYLDKKGRTPLERALDLKR